MKKFATIAVAVFAYASASFAVSPVAQATENNNTKYTVVAGDTLDGIAKAHKTTYVRLFNANTSLIDPNIIDVGQVLRIPGANEKLAERALPAPAVQQSVSVATPVTTYSSYQQSYYQPTATKKPAATHASGSGVWDKIAQCESGGNWSINTGNGYTGGLQFANDTWAGYGGYSTAAQAPREVQIQRAEQIRNARGGYSAWPACSAQLGL